MLRCIGIDDEFSCNELLTEYCSRIPFVDLVATFTDPLLALPLIQDGKLDLIFLDFYMSPMNTPAFLPHIPSSIKVVITTSELLSRIKDYQLNVAEIIAKPYSFETFKDKLGVLIDVVYQWHQGRMKLENLNPNTSSK